MYITEPGLKDGYLVIFNFRNTFENNYRGGTSKDTGLSPAAVTFLSTHNVYIGRCILFFMLEGDLAAEKCERVPF